MTWTTAALPRIPRRAAEDAATAMYRLRTAARQLLLDHARDHVKRHRGEIECIVCRNAAGAVHHVDQVLAGDYFR